MNVPHKLVGLERMSDYSGLTVSRSLVYLQEMLHANSFKKFFDNTSGNIYCS